jgi:hypothetical protein
MRLLIVTVAFATAFVFLTSGSLPPLVASHFIAGGTANGFMPRATYLRFVITLLVGLPLFVALISTLTSVLPARFVNVPNREYWLAPERQADTVDYLRKHGTRFAVLLAVFLCFVHWLVVQANERNPAHFPETLFFAGMAAFIVGLAIWLGSLIVHFRRHP